MTALQLLIVAASAAAASALLVPPVYHWARQRQIVAVPNERSSHAQPTPVGGGLPIVACVIVGVLLFRDAAGPVAPGWWTSYLIGALAVAAISWWDDVQGVSAGARLAVHVVAALTVLVPLVQGLSPAGAAVVLVIGLIWIVGLSNAYNFMDGIDGIAAAQAIVAGAGWAWLGWIDGDAMSAAIGALVAGGSLGFLFYNWHPAKIFMGDAGAAVIGFTFATLTVVASVRTAGVDRGVAGALFVWPFLFDSTFTFFRRLRRGENVFRAHRGHLYQRLVAAGWSHARATTLYAALSAIGVALAATWISNRPQGRFIVAGAMVLLCAALWMVTLRAERRASRS